MDKKTIVHNGVEMAEGWPQQIEDAQKDSTYQIGGVQFVRVRYGKEKEDWGAERQLCADCAVAKGQFHVPGCDVERCPRCGGQVITCHCPYDDEVASSIADASVNGSQTKPRGTDN